MSVPTPPPALTDEEKLRMRGDIEALKVALGDGKITTAEFLDLAGRAMRWPWATIWKIAAAALVALGLLGGTAAVAVKSVDPAPVTDLVQVVKDGLSDLGAKMDASAKTLTQISMKLDEKPIPKPEPDKDDVVTIPAELIAKVGEPVFLTTKAKAAFRWVTLPDTQAHFREFGHELMIVPKTEGHFRVGLVSLVKGKISPVEWTMVKCGKGPQPPPEPEPKPPEPKPDAPIPVAGFRVLIVYESMDISKMSFGQQAVIFGKTFRDYLDAKCVVGPDGKTKEYRIFDKDIVTSGEAKLWQDAMRRPRAGVPWMLVSNGKSGWEGPLPSVEEALTILKRYEQ